MGYRVLYPGKSGSRIREKRRFYRRVLTVFCFSVFLLLVNFCWPRGREVLRQLLFPGNSVVAVAALNDMAAELSYGESWPDALSGFWQKVGLHAG